MGFEKLGLGMGIVSIMNEYGYTDPTEIQIKAIPYILEKKDIVGRSETGSGKTFAFALPVLQNIDKEDSTLQALVVCPTRELAMQDADEIKRVADKIGIKVCVVFGGSNLQRQVDALKRKPQVVVGTPGRIIDLINKGALKIESANVVVLDEADEMLDMGFRPDIENIFSHTKKEKQVVLFSATIPNEIKDIINKYLSNYISVEVGSENKALDKIDQRFIFTNQKQKEETLKQLFLSDLYGKTIVFVNTKIYAQRIQTFLNRNKIECRAIHGDLRQNDRRKVLNGYKSGKFDILIATDVAARGIDIKDVQYVVNYDLPQQLEFYVHRIGRTARAGKQGKVIDIVTNLAQLSYMRDIEKATKAKILPYETESANLKELFIDTAKLARENSRFGKKSQEKERYKKPHHFSMKNQQRKNRDAFDKKSDKQTKNTHSKFLDNKKSRKSNKVIVTEVERKINKKHEFNKNSSDVKSWSANRNRTEKKFHNLKEKSLGRNKKTYRSEENFKANKEEKRHSKKVSPKKTWYSKFKK